MEKKKSKKWLIILSLLILIAIVVTLVIVFLPKDTNRIIDQTISQSQSMFLSDSDQQELYADFKGKVAADKLEDVENYQKLSGQLSIVMDFYASNILFVQSSSALQSQYDKINRAYQTINQSKEELSRLLKEVEKLSRKETTFIQGATEQIEAQLKSYFKSNIEVSEALAQVYKESTDKGVILNDMTFLILDMTNSFLREIYAQLDAKVQDSLQAKINAFDKFLTYFTDTTQIENYVFDKTLQDQVEKIRKFEELYGKTFDNLIGTIQNSGLTFSSDVVDTEGVLDTVKAFLKF